MYIIVKNFYCYPDGREFLEKHLFFPEERDMIELRKKTNWIKGEHGYFAGSTPEGGSSGGSGGNSGLTNAENGGIIKKEIENGNIKLEINPEKQARHIKGRPEYKEGRSYITISEQEAQDIINSKSGTGILVKDRKGNWKHKELIDCGKEIGVFVEPISKNKIPTNKATIHYSKTGTHLVPRK